MLGHQRRVATTAGFSALTIHSSRRRFAARLNSGVRQLVMLQSHSWKQSGAIALWRYKENQRNFPGWHLTADATGCASLLALLDAFASDGGTCSRTLAIQAPTLAILAVPNNRSSAWRSPSKLRLSLSENPAEWSFPESLEPATLTFGWDWLPKLRQGIAGIPHGEGDYSIGGSGSSNLQLWFWWQPAAAA